MNRRSFIGGVLSAAAAIPAVAMGVKAAEPDDGSSVVKNCTIDRDGGLHLQGRHIVVENVRTIRRVRLVAPVDQ